MDNQECQKLVLSWMEPVDTRLSPIEQHVIGVEAIGPCQGELWYILM